MKIKLAGFISIISLLFLANYCQAATVSSGPFTGSTNYIPKWNGSTYADSIMTDTLGSIRFNGNLILTTAGNGLYLKEGTDATMGDTDLVAGTATISTTKVTANSRIFLTIQSTGGTPGSPYISSRIAGTSFVISDTVATDTSNVAWILIEPY